MTKLYEEVNEFVYWLGPEDIVDALSYPRYSVFTKFQEDIRLPIATTLVMFLEKDTKTCPNCWKGLDLLAEWSDEEVKEALIENLKWRKVM